MFMLPRGGAAADTPSLPRSDSWSGFGGGGFGGYESFEGGAAASAALAAARGPSGGEPELEILVGVPEAVSDGIATDFEYPLRTRSSLPAFAGATGVVRRRLTDFACLRERLRAFCPGIVVPPLPEYPRLADASPWGADALGGGEEGGAGGARGALQAFCGRVAAHPLLRECPDLALFLSSAPPAPGAPAGAAWADALRWYERAAVVGPAVASAVTSLIDSFAARADLLLAGGSVAGGAGGGGGSGIEEDAVHADASAYVTALEQQLAAAAQAAAAAIAAARAQAARLRELGGAAGALGASEQAGCHAVLGQRGAPSGAAAPAAAGGSLGDALLAVGSLAAECAGPVEEAALAAQAGCTAPLRAALRTCAAVREVMADRAAALARLQAAAARHALRLERLADSAAAEAAAPPPRDAIAAGLDPDALPEARRAAEAEVAAAAAALEAAKEAYDVIVGRMAAELPRVHAELARDVAAALRALVAALGDAAAAQAAAWSRLVPGAADAPLPWPPAVAQSAAGDEARA